MIGRCLALAAALFVLIQLVASANLLIDQDPFEVSKINLCQLAGDKRIGRISSIGNLLEYVKASSDLSCHSLWLQPLKDLQQILDSSSTDACSLVTASKIEQFHWSYIVGTLSKSWFRASKAALPEALRQFFVHFVDQTIAKCKTVVGERLRQAVGGRDIGSGSLTDGSANSMVDSLSIALVPESKVEKFEDFFFIFNSITSLEKREGDPALEETPDAKTGEVTYASVKIYDATKSHAMQEKCKQELRPIYANTVLPVMKLVDLGYGTMGETFRDNNMLIANWYALTQQCELILPIKFYEDKTLKRNQVVFLKNDEIQASKSQTGSDALQQVANVRAEPAHLDFLQDILPSALNDSAVKRVKENFKSRTRIYRKTFRSVLKAAKAGLKAKLKSILLPKRTKDGGYEEADLTESLDQADKIVTQDELDDKMDQGSLVRTKRGFEIFSRELIDHIQIPADAPKWKMERSSAKVWIMKTIGVMAVVDVALLYFL